MTDRDWSGSHRSSEAGRAGWQGRLRGTVRDVIDKRLTWVPTVSPRVWRRLEDSSLDGYLLLGLGVGILISVAYLFTHQYPAYAGGLFIEIAEQLHASGYRIPERVSGYTAEGIPFAYPPLLFYLTAFVIEELGLGAFTYTRILPGLVVTLTAIPFYGTARELLDTNRQAGVATIVYLTAPETLQWHISAGGIVRAPAMLLALTGTYAGVRLFRDADRRWVVPATVLFGLTVLSHPHYTAFFGLTYLVLFVVFERTGRGLRWGILVAAGGFVLAAPWWIQVLLSHGPGVFMSAAGTHSGLLGGPYRLARVFLSAPSLLLLFDLLALAGLLHGIVTRRVFLTTWFVSSGYVIGKPRFIFVAGAMLVSLLLIERIGPLVTWRSARAWGHTATVAIVCGLVVTGLLYTSGALASHGGGTQPAFVDEEDIAAMAWVESSTPATAEFVVLGDAAEWFPQQAGRPILLGPWGVEWTNAPRYRYELKRYRTLSHCHTAHCLTTGLEADTRTPTHIYVPKGRYTVRGFGATQPPSMRRTLIKSDRYHLRYENEGVMIFSVSALPASPAASQPPPALASAPDRARWYRPARSWRMCCAPSTPAAHSPGARIQAR